jgi:hypothetical protein
MPFNTQKIKEIYFLKSKSSDCHLRFHKHLHSYEVAIVNNIVTTSYDELLDYHSLDIYAVKTDGIMRKYIRM